MVTLETFVLMMYPRSNMFADKARRNPLLDHKCSADCKESYRTVRLSASDRETSFIGPLPCATLTYEVEAQCHAFCKTVALHDVTYSTQGFVSTIAESTCGRFTVWCD